MKIMSIRDEWENCKAALTALGDMIGCSSGSEIVASNELKYGIKIIIDNAVERVDAAFEADRNERREA